MSGFWKPEPVERNRRLRQNVYDDDNDNYYFDDVNLSSSNNNEEDHRTRKRSSSSRRYNNVQNNSSLQQHRMLLPVYKHKKQILYAVETYGVVIIVGETGSGKSTQIPQYLVQEGGWSDHDFQVVCTQPRRIAAITLATRVNIEMGGTSDNNDTNRLVGYCVRFDNTNKYYNTKILYVTDGMLVREATTTDPLLSKYSVIIVDEAHERTIHTDILLGMLKMIRRKRPTLRIIICSATIDAQLFLNFFVNSDNDRTATDDDDVMSDNQNNNNTPMKLNNSDNQIMSRKRSRWDNEYNNSTNNNVSFTSRNDTSHASMKTNNKTQQQYQQKQFINKGTIISVDGRQYPVDILYASEPVSDYLVKMVEVAYQIVQQQQQQQQQQKPGEYQHRNNSRGNDILCFLPSSEQIDDAIRMAQEAFENDQIMVNQCHIELLPLYGNLPYDMQERVFQQQVPTTKNHTKQANLLLLHVRIIFATNVAETSVTVPNVQYVIDSGFAKLPYYDPNTGLERLIVCPISQANAKQRSGRAGRIDCGICYRLYTETYYREQMSIQTIPEIVRTNSIASIILTLKSIGITNILLFDMIDIPTIDSLIDGFETLFALDAIDVNGTLTSIGKQMSVFPTEPRVSRMLLHSIHYEHCTFEVLAIASALQVRDLFLKPPSTSRNQHHHHHQQQYDGLDYHTARAEYIDSTGDHITYVNMFHDMDTYCYNYKECCERYINYTSIKHGIEIRNQLGRYIKKHYGRIETFGNNNNSNNIELRRNAILKCVTAGFFFNIAKLENDGRYYTLRKQNIPVTPSSTSTIFTTSAATSGKYRPYNNSMGIGNSYRSEYILFSETVDGPRGGIELKHVSTIEAKWLRELAPHYWE